MEKIKVVLILIKCFKVKIYFINKYKIIKNWDNELLE